MSGTYECVREMLKNLADMRAARFRMEKYAETGNRVAGAKDSR